jgi:hypothetical protein
MRRTNEHNTSQGRARVSAADPIPFIPERYVRRECAGFGLWSSPEESPLDLDFLADVVLHARTWLEDVLAFVPKRSLHICVCANNQTARASLDRPVPANMATAAFTSREASLVVVQSRRAHPSNGDGERMRRVLVYELCHVFARERTGSRQVLGDGKRDLRIRPWLDEGFAEVLSLMAVGAALPGARASDADWTYDALDEHLCALSSESRELASISAASDANPRVNP